MPLDLNALEQRVMEMLLAGDDPVLRILRQQFHSANVVARELSGVGFFTKFSVPPAIQRVKERKLSHLGDVKAEIEGLEYGADFVLHIRNGAIDCLEGSTCEGAWPESVQNFHISYIDGDERDLTALWKKWAG